ncbi:hypothetical protein FQN55_005451 [Onygenales sp. PD_40]|nr:hypothetical protein FQN55_005451 [Onygenales sp. PD_40]
MTSDQPPIYTRRPLPGHTSDAISFPSSSNSGQRNRVDRVDGPIEAPPYTRWLTDNRAAARDDGPSPADLTRTGPTNSQTVDRNNTGPSTDERPRPEITPPISIPTGSGNRQTADNEDSSLDANAPPANNQGSCRVPGGSERNRYENGPPLDSAGPAIPPYGPAPPPDATAIQPYGPAPPPDATAIQPNGPAPAPHATAAPPYAPVPAPAQHTCHTHTHRCNYQRTWGGRIARFFGLDIFWAPERPRRRRRSARTNLFFVRFPEGGRRDVPTIGRTRTGEETLYGIESVRDPEHQRLALGYVYLSQEEVHNISTQTGLDYHTLLDFARDGHISRERGGQTIMVIPGSPPDSDEYINHHLAMYNRNIRDAEH